MCGTEKAGLRENLYIVNWYWHVTYYILCDILHTGTVQYMNKRAYPP